jgi:hypothetical protein
MTRLRVYVNPESRDILVHAQEKKHSAPWGAVTFQIGPLCAWRDQRQFRAAASAASAVRDRATRIGQVAIGKEGSPVTADTDRKPGCLDMSLT